MYDLASMYCHLDEFEKEGLSGDQVYTLGLHDFLGNIVENEISNSCWIVEPDGFSYSVGMKKFNDYEGALGHTERRAETEIVSPGSQQVVTHLYNTLDNIVNKGLMESNDYTGAPFVVHKNGDEESSPIELSFKLGHLNVSVKTPLGYRPSGPDSVVVDIKTESPADLTEFDVENLTLLFSYGRDHSAGMSFGDERVETFYEDNVKNKE